MAHRTLNQAQHETAWKLAEWHVCGMRQDTLDRLNRLELTAMLLELLAQNTACHAFAGELEKAYRQLSSADIPTDAPDMPKIFSLLRTDPALLDIRHIAMIMSIPHQLIAMKQMVFSASVGLNTLCHDGYLVGFSRHTEPSAASQKRQLVLQ